MSRFDHQKMNGRDRIARQGEDNILDFSLPGGLAPPRLRPSKTSLRAEADAAVASITRIVVCVCGHRARVAIPLAWVGKKTLRCSECGERSSA